MNTDIADVLAPVQIEAIVLRRTEFQRADVISDERGEVSVQLDLRSAIDEDRPDRLIVELTANLEEPDTWRGAVQYVGLFVYTGEFTDDVTPEDIWPEVARRLGPVVLYPYVRETASMLLNKAGVSNIIPPVIDFGKADVEVAQPLDGATEEKGGKESED